MRYLRLYAHFLRFSFSRAMQFRLDFFFRIGMDIVWNLTHLAFFSVLYLHTETLAGWTFDQVLVFVATLFVADALQMTFTSNNMWMFPLLVNKGDLDYYLVRPVSALFFVSLRDFAANSFVNLLIALGILAWAIGRYPEPVGGGVVVLYLAMLLTGTFLAYVLAMLSLIPVFWLHSAAGLREVYWALSSMSNRPHRIYRGVVRRVVLTILPFGVLFSLPADTFFSPRWETVAHIVGTTAVFFGLLLWSWKKGLRAYASASS